MTILIFAGILIVLILVHEFGHFITAKMLGIRVDEFGLGFPPRLFGIKRGETEYTFNALPIGGFVRIWGEDAADVPENDPDKPRSFAAKSRIAQAIVLTAGVIFNALFAWVLFSIGFITGMPSSITEEEIPTASDVRLLITEVLPGSPASEAGIIAGDQIIGVAGDSTISTLTPTTVANLIGAQGEKEMLLVVTRGGKEHQLYLTPKKNIIPDEPDRAAAGFVMTLAGVVTLPVGQAIIEGARMTYDMGSLVLVGLIKFLGQAFSLTADFSQVSGPVGIVGLVGDAKALGFAYLLTFTGFISLNLAAINLLPFPALDGGRLFFVIIESIVRRPIPPNVTKTLNAIGFIFLIMLMLAVTVSDVVKLF